jgi:hypothetical protein
MTREEASMDKLTEHFSAPKQENGFTSLATGIGTVVGGIILVGYLFGGQAGMLTLPHRCDDVTTSQLNYLYKDNAGLVGKIEFLDIINRTDTGTYGDNMKCKIEVVTSRGQMAFKVDTRMIGGKEYLEAKPDLGF